MLAVVIKLLNRYFKLLGKYVTYLGHFTGVAGIVWGNLYIFLLGLGLVTIGTITHEVNEK